MCVCAMASKSRCVFALLSKRDDCVLLYVCPVE